MPVFLWLCLALAGRCSAKLSLARASFYTDDGECAGKARQLSGLHGCGPAKIYWLSPMSDMGLDVDANLRFACKGERLYVTQCEDDKCTESCTPWQLVPDISPGDCVGEAIRFNCVTAGDAPRPVHVQDPVGSTPAPQYNALVDLYVATRGGRWSETANWLQGDPCDGAWFGVRCSGGNVSQLTLTGNGLNGTLPSSLGALSHLEELSLSWNADLTSKLPDIFGDMKRLRRVYLEGTGFRGRLPPSIGQLAALTQLHLSHTKLQVRLSDVALCVYLEILSLEKAQHVSGSLHDLAGLTRLHELTLKGNALQGFTLDGIGTLRALRILDVTDTRTEGVIPDEFDVNGSCSLEQLRASKNYISGAIPSSLAACGSLRVLDVGDNSLQGALPPFASAVKVVVRSNYLTDLAIDFDGPATTLDLSDNPFNVQLPASLGAAGGSLRDFQCYHCGLRGPLPTTYSAAMTKLVLHSNNIDGTLERALADLPKLHTLDLDDNEIGGELPITFGRFKGPLETIRLRHNRLQGTLPEGMLLQQHLSEVMLDDNQFTGILGAGMAESGLKFAFDLISVHHNRFTAVSAALLQGMHVTPKAVELEAKAGAESQQSGDSTGDAVRRGYLRLTDNPAAEVAIKGAGGAPGGRPNNFCYASDETHNSIYDDILAEADYAELKPGCHDGTARSLSWKANDCRSFSSFQRGLWYPSTSCLYDKGEFSLNMELMRKMFPREFDFYPPTFRLPYQIGEFRTEFKRQGDKALWLLKPMLSCCGKGIRLVKPESLTEEVVNDVDEHGGWFAMQFVHPPYLVHEQKFVIRVYTVLSSFAPLRMSIYDEPMMFWTGYENQDGVQTYSTADPRKKDRYITNWFFNNVTATCPLTLTKLAPFLEKRGDSVEKLWNGVRDVVVRAMLGVQTRMSRKSRRLSYPNTVYECFIYDIVVTDKLEPKVCEINVDANLAREVNYMDETSPGYPHELDDSFAGDRMEKEDDVFKKNLNRDILRLHGVLPGLTQEQEDAALARINASLHDMELDCTDAQRTAAASAGLYKTDMLHPCLEAADRAELARLELHTSLHDAGADKEGGAEARTRFQHSFPCFDCAKHLHLMPELHRHDLVGVWWMEQVANAGARNVNASIPWAKWVRSTLVAVMARRVNTKWEGA